MKIRNLMVGASATVLAISGAGVSLPAFAQAAAADEGAEVGAIVVTGRRAALQAAEDRKKNSDKIVDSVVADEAGKLPDNSITEVLQRVAGVTIVRFASLGDPDHFSVEGSGIQVRGLSGVASRLNGREIFSANAGRSLLWGDVTPELMSAVDVYKSASADQIEGGTGGSVDLRTKLPFDYSRGVHFAGSSDISMGDLAQKTDYSVSGLVTGNWDTSIGRIGVLLDGAYSQFSSNSHFFRMEPYFRTNIGGTDYFIPGGYDYGEEDFQRKRDGLYAAVQWAPSDDLTLTGIFFQSRYRNRSSEWGSFVTSQTLAVDPSVSTFDDNNGLISSPAVFQRDPGTFLPNGNQILSGGTAGGSRSNSKTQDYSLSFDWTPGDGPLSVRGGYQHILSTSKVDRVAIFRDFAFPTSFGLDLSNGLPEVTLPSSFAPNFVDPSQYFWTAAMPHNEDNRGKMDAANIDLEYTFDDGFFKSVQVGGRWAKRTERDFNNQFAWSALGRGWNGDPQLTYANAAPGDTELHVFKDFFHGSAALPGNQLFPSLDLVRRNIADASSVFDSPPDGFCGAPFATGSWWNCSAAGALPSTGYGGAPGRPVGFVLPNDQTDYSTETLAGYAMVRFGHDMDDGSSISGNVGARIVKLKNASTGYFVQNSALFIFEDGSTVMMPGIAGLRTGKADFTRVLPAINVQYAPDGQWKVRGAYNITMDLPSFTALRASGSLGVATTPNPNSTPTMNLPPIFTNFTTDSGNPFLKPAMSNNIDLSVEWYPKSGTTLHLAAFYKHITNLPIYSSTQQPVTVVFDDGSSLDVTAVATDVRNADKAATVKGFEFGGRVFFDQLPGMLSGIGLEGNYTFIDSKNPGDLYRDIAGNVRNDASLQGLSKHNYNIALLYEHNPFSVRVAYSWRSKYLQSTNSNGTNPVYTYYSAPGVGTSTQIALPIYGAAYGTMDASVTFKVTENFSFNVQGSNLLNSTAKTLMGGYPNGKLYTRSWFQSDRRLSAGINLSF